MRISFVVINFINLKLNIMEPKSLKISFFIKRSKLLNNGDAPIYCKIKLDDIIRDVGIKKSINPKFWDSQLGNVMHAAGKSSMDCNKEINLFNNGLYEAKDNLEKIGNDYNIDDLINLFKRKESKTTLLGLFDKHNQKIEKQVGISNAKSTIVKYRTLRRHTFEFIAYKYKKNDITLVNINNDFIEDFVVYLKTNKGIAHNTTLKYLQLLNKIILIAINDGLKQEPNKVN